MLTCICVLSSSLSGLRSLVSNTIYAFTNATAKLSLTARKGLVVLGLEDESRMPLARRGVPRSARLTPTEPFDSGLAEAILAGLAGLLSEPVRGVEEAGLVGLVRGTMRGFVGLLVRPVARSLEMCSRVADSIQVIRVHLSIMCSIEGATGMPIDYTSHLQIVFMCLWTNLSPWKELLFKITEVIQVCLNSKQYRSVAPFLITIVTLWLCLCALQNQDAILRFRDSSSDIPKSQLKRMSRFVELGL